MAVDLVDLGPCDGGVGADPTEGVRRVGFACG